MPTPRGRGLVRRRLLQLRTFPTDKESLLGRYKPLTAAEEAKLRSWAHRGPA